MKIVNTESGTALQLAPDTQLSVERTNPFFHEYGEQTLPVSIPDSPHNRKVLKQPEMISRRIKPSLMDATIQDGEYFIKCRQAVLEVNPGEKIETSFYMNEGSLFSRLTDTYITEVFRDEKVPGISTVDDAIEYCRNLLVTGGNEMFSCFPVMLPSVEYKLGESTMSENRFINQVDRTGSSVTFYNAVARTEHVDEQEIYLLPGFYISPFLKANYVLKRLFAYFGYTLQENFFTQTHPFPSMVFINNVADAIVTGYIKLDQLIPQVTCNTILDLFRKKFACEFLPDEVHRTVSIVLMKDVLSSKADYNLTDKLVGRLKVEFPDNYQQIILEPEHRVADEMEMYDSLPLIKSKYPLAMYDDASGSFYRIGYHYGLFLFDRIWSRKFDFVGASDQRYYEGGNLPTKKITIPEAIPLCSSLSTTYFNSVVEFPLFIGKGRFLNSSMQDPTSADGNVTASEDVPMYLMLAFSDYLGWAGYTVGTVTAYSSKPITEDSPTFGWPEQFSEYALIYNGPNGIFERFYRPWDDILRNSMHKVKASLLLDQHSKLVIPATGKVSISGIDLLIDKLAYTIGGRNKPVESEFYTVQLYEPVSTAKSIYELMATDDTGYEWVTKELEHEISASEYENSEIKDVEIKTVFPSLPLPEYVGKRMYLQNSAICTGLSGYYKYYFISCWLEVQPKTST